MANNLCKYCAQSMRVLIINIIILMLLAAYIQVDTANAEYTVGDLRDPFKSYLPKSSFSKTSSTIVKELSKLNLSGIMWGKDMPLAIINGKVYKIGDAILGIKIVEINKHGVLLKYQGESFILKPK